MNSSCRFLLRGLAAWCAASVSLAWAQPRVVINEIHFEPPEKKPLEFVELHNVGSTEALLNGWQLGKFRFGAAHTIAPEIGRAHV